jgi:uncharacterized protein (DUF488 family)
MSAASENSIYQLYSIGHGNKSSEEFLALLNSFQIEYLADIRSYPSSKRNPHFNRENLQLALDQAGIFYGWFPDLGGFRKEGLGNRSPHVALKSPGFRNYADYMSTESFSTAADKLIKLAALDSTCIMCAETIPQRCHRLLLSDYLLVQGCKIIHILDHQRTIDHQLSHLATASEGRIIYNRSEPQQMEMKPND